tara:strand:+ start:353 stop:1015 length:663 start_codon:yes stop_codon:yes gene_type:complete
MYFKNSNKNELINYKVGIVAVSHKRFGELKVFVQSIINQTNKNWSLHVIHDGKNDEFLNIMDSYQCKDPKRITYECTNRRYNDYGHTLRETGLRKSCHEYTMLTNSDNYYPPKTLEFINQAIKASTLSRPDVVMFDMTHSHIDVGRKKKPSYSFFDVFYKINYIDIGAVIVNTELAQKVGFVDKSFAGDATYFEDILKQKNKEGLKLNVVKIPRVLLVHN